MSLWVLFFLFILLMIITLSPRIDINSKWTPFLRILLPSWRFFEDIGHKHSLWIKSISDPEWIRIQHPAKLSPWVFIHNPDVNLRFALDSLLDLFLLDVAKLQSTDSLNTNDHEAQEIIENLQSYKLILNSISYIGRLNTQAALPDIFQFKIQSVPQGSNDLSGEVQFISNQISFDSSEKVEIK